MTPSVAPTHTTTAESHDMPRNAAAPSPDGPPRRTKPRGEVSPIGARRRRMVPPAPVVSTRIEETVVRYDFPPVRAELLAPESFEYRPGRPRPTAKEQIILDGWARSDRDAIAARKLVRGHHIAPERLGALLGWQRPIDDDLYDAAHSEFVGLRDVTPDARGPRR